MSYDDWGDPEDMWGYDPDREEDARYYEDEADDDGWYDDENEVIA